MLSSRYNLKGSENIERVKKQGRLYKRKLFGVVILARKDKEPSRFVFIVSTKVSKLSIQRNRVKRAMSEAVRHMITRMKEGYDVVFLAKKETERKSTEEIMREVKMFLMDINLVK